MHEEIEEIFLCENIKREYEVNNEYEESQGLSENNIKCENWTNDDYRGDQDSLALQDHFGFSFGLLKNDIKKDEVIEDDHSLQDETSVADLQHTSGELDCEDTDNIEHIVDSTELTGRRILGSSILLQNEISINSEDISQVSRLGEQNSSALSEFLRSHNKKNFEEKSKITKKNSCSVEEKSKIYKCDSCHLKFSKLSPLEQHRVINEENRFVCDVCSELFLKFPLVRNHFNAVNCEKRSETSSEELSSNRNKNFACGNCDMRYSNILMVRRHIVQVHSGIGVCKCVQCNETFSQSCEFKIHTCPIQNLFEKYECQVCNWQFSNQDSLRIHSDVHIERKYICADCNKRFVQFADLKNHIKSVHYKKESGSSKKINTHKPYACENCDERYSWITDLKSHITVAHLGVGYYKCVACNKLFLRSCNLKKHLQLEHKELSFEKRNKKYVCGDCDKRYPDFVCLQEHIKMFHLRMDIYKCNQCNKRYSSSSAFKRHMNSEKHKNFNKFECDICKKKYSKLRSLGCHINIHIKTINVCEYCAKTFPTIGNLNRHINYVHHKIRNFECQLCNKKFKRRHHLQNHITCVHENVKKFVCEKCGSKFSLVHNLKKHVIEVHKGTNRVANQ